RAAPAGKHVVLLRQLPSQPRTQRTSHAPVRNPAAGPARHRCGLLAALAADQLRDRLVLHGARADQQPDSAGAGLRTPQLPGTAWSPGGHDATALPAWTAAAWRCPGHARLDSSIH